MTKKKSLYKIPKPILSKLKTIERPEILVVAIINIPKPEIKAGRFTKFGIKYSGDKLILGEKFMPRPSFGKCTRENKFGKMLKRKDLPKISKTFSIEVPNYGDWGKGSHEITWDRMVYQKDKVPPKNISISPEIVADRNEELVVGFKIEDTLNKSDKNFQDELLFRLNLLQENFGTCDVFSVDEPLQERKDYKKLNWEILPPGWWADREKVREIKERLGSREGELLIERLRYIKSLNPLESYEGKTLLGNRLYYVFVFNKNVLAECPMFGNAIYILSEDKKDSWQEIFAKTKREVLKIGVVRLTHRGDWRKKLIQILS